MTFRLGRRRFLAAAAAVGAPLVLSRNAWGVSWIRRGGPVKVGVLFSQTGDLAVVEGDCARVAQYAIDEINAGGGIAGMQVEPVMVDAKSDVRIYAAKIGELILKDRVICTFGGYTSASRRVVAPIVGAHDHLLFFPAWYEGRECTQNMVCTGPLPNQLLAELIPFMVSKFGPKAYLVGSDDIRSKEIAKHAKAGLEQAGGEVVGEDYVPLGGTDLAPVFAGLRQQQPSFILSTAVGGSDVALHRGYKDEGFDSDKMPIASLATSEVEAKAMGPELVAGHFLSAPYFQSLSSPTNRRFVESYLKSPYGGTGVTHHTMEQTYLSIQVWKRALEKALAAVGPDAVTPRTIRDACGGIRVEDDASPQGLVWIDPDNFNIWLRPRIGQCRGYGQFKVVQTAEAHVGPDPFALYPDLGTCKPDGLHKPGGSVVPSVL